MHNIPCETQLWVGMSCTDPCKHCT